MLSRQNCLISLLVAPVNSSRTDKWQVLLLLLLLLLRSTGDLSARKCTCVGSKYSTGGAFLREAKTLATERPERLHVWNVDCHHTRRSLHRWGLSGIILTAVH